MNPLLLTACAGFLSIAMCWQGDAQGPCEVLKVANPYDDRLFDDFGYSVLVQGQTALVGMPADGNVPGQVFVFEQQPWGWYQTQILEASDAKPKNQFGHSLALDGDTLAVGAYRVGELDVKGAVYIFDRQPDGTWVETQKLASTDPKVWALGWSVALEGNELVAGAVGAVALGDGAGRVLFYKREASGWVWKNTYPSPDSKEGDNFGTSLALEGDYLVVGSNQANGPPPKQGRAYVYQHYPLAWIYNVTLSSPALIDGARFGEDVAISGARILVGAPGLQIEKGAAFVFDLLAGSWMESAQLTASDGHVLQDFGWSLDLDGDRAIIGAWGDDAAGDHAGAAYLFEPTGRGWQEVIKFSGSGVSAADTFGHCVDLEGQDFLVGAPSVGSDPSSSFGDAYFFTFATGPHLTTDSGAVSLSQGGEQSLAICACSDHAGDMYFLAGTATGTAPGFVFADLLVPLNPDVYFLFTVNHPGTPPLAGSFGFLDESGTAEASFALSAGTTPTLAGLTLNHAYAVLDATTLQLEAVSPAVPVTLEP